MSLGRAAISLKEGSISSARVEPAGGLMIADRYLELILGQCVPMLAVFVQCKTVRVQIDTAARNGNCKGGDAVMLAPPQDGVNTDHPYRLLGPPSPPFGWVSSEA